MGVDYELGERKAPPLKSILDELDKDGVAAESGEEEAAPVTSLRKKDDEVDLKAIKFEDLADLSEKIMEDAKNAPPPEEKKKKSDLINVDGESGERPRLELKMKIDPPKKPVQQPAQQMAPIAVHDEDL